MGFGASLVAASNACDPWPNECDESYCDGNTAVFCEQPVDGHNYEHESKCPLGTSCFISAPGLQKGTDLDAFCGRLQPDGTSCAPVGATSCQGADIRVCVLARDRKSYWLDLKCSDYAGYGTCTPNSGGAAASCL